MFYTNVTTDGVVGLLPKKIITAAAGNISTIESTRSVSGTVVLDTTVPGTGTVTLGFLTDSSPSGTFIPFDDGLMAGNDIHVNHGVGVLLAASVTGVTGTLRIGYAGESS